MKKVFSLVAAVALVSLAACSNNASEEAATEMDSVATEVVAEPAMEEAAPVDTAAATDTTATPAAN